MQDTKYVIKQNFLSSPIYKGGGIMAALLLCLCFIFSQLYWNDLQPVANYLVSSGEKVFSEHEYWRLWTTLFVHGDLGHLLSNSLMFAVMGIFVYSHYGPWVFPGLCLFMGGVLNIFVLKTMNPEHMLLGISGVVYFLWGYWLILYILIQRHVSLNRRLMKVVAITLLVLVPTSYRPEVSYFSHGLGGVLGVISGLIYYSFNHSYIRSMEEWEEIDENEIGREE